MLKGAFVFPHPPLILPHIGRGREREVQKTIDSCHECAKAIARLKPDTVVLSSPHYSSGEADHGTAVPLWFVDRYYKDYELIRLGLSRLSYSEHFQVGKNIAEKMTDTGSVVYIASGDLSHVLKEDGPYGFAPEGPVFDKKVIDILAGGNLKELLNIDPALAENAAECGLRSFIIMAGFLDGAKITPKLHSYEDTFGVGYAVASFIVEQ